MNRPTCTVTQDLVAGAESARNVKNTCDVATTRGSSTVLEVRPLAMADRPDVDRSVRPTTSRPIPSGEAFSARMVGAVGLLLNPAKALLYCDKPPTPKPYCDRPTTP